MAGEPGPLIGVGRSADVFDVGGGRVLRRYRHAHLSAEREAAVMAWLGARGFPVPTVHDADGSDLVMDRIDGPTLLRDMGDRPWTLRSAGDVLAGLHERLHAIDAADLIAADIVGRTTGAGNQIVHLDLHPDNVILTADGPVVIDWANVAVGDGDADMAYVWIILECATLPGAVPRRALNAVGRRVFRRAFLRHFDREKVAAALLRLVEEGAAGVRNFDATELARLDRFVLALKAGAPPR